MDTLVLPKRFEILERVASENQVDLSTIIQPIPESDTHIDQLLREVEIGKIGKLEIIYGKAGSGKTTFVKSLAFFYKNVNINIYPHTRPLIELADDIEKREHISKEKLEIYLLIDRDNPNESDEDISKALENLRRAFRTKNGNVLVLWPITKEKSALSISKMAWDVGRDSLVRSQTKGIMNFNGINKEDYWSIADLTSRSLNAEGLETYGLSVKETAEEVQAAETIGEYYSLLESKAAANIQSYERLLKGKLIPKIWILLPGDDSVEIERTVRTLTQGTRNKIDADRICEYLDDESNSSAYLSEWRKRRSQAIFLLRQLDVRLFELAPNISLPVIRCFGIDTVKANLVKKTESERNAIDSIKKTRLYQVLNDPSLVGTTSARATQQETKDEYNRVQIVATDRDHELNKSIAIALEKAFLEDAITCEVIAEKRNLNGYPLQPDIQLVFSESNVICLEPTWRTTGIEKTDDPEKRTQNTLTTGHIQKYVLEKVLEYLKVIGM